MSKKVLSNRITFLQTSAFYSFLNILPRVFLKQTLLVDLIAKWLDYIMQNLQQTFICKKNQGFLALYAAHMAVARLQGFVTFSVLGLVCWSPQKLSVAFNCKMYR